MLCTEPATLQFAPDDVSHHSLTASGTAAIAGIAAHPFLATLTAGAVAGISSRTLTAPLDRLKVLAQEGRVAADQGNAARMRSLVHHVYHCESGGGLLCFWRGNGVNCLKAGPEFALAFATREAVAARLCGNAAQPTAVENVFLGAVSGLTAQLVVYPLEVIKTRIAVAAHTEYRGIYDCAAQSMRRGGVRDAYRGLCANLVGIVPHRGLEMGAFFTMEQALHRSQPRQQHLAPWQYAGIGFAASVASQVVTYPLNMARTRLQTQGVNGRLMRYRGLVHCLSSVARTEGVRGVFAGLAPNMLKAAPASAVMYTVFREIKDFFDDVAASA
jgi:solute carrier family 25 phosphate transporter 23/24/25/41